MNSAVLRLVSLAMTSASMGLTGCGALRPLDPRFPVPGDYEQTVWHEHERSYLLHVPTDYQAKKSWPLVVVLHGAFSDGTSTEKLTDFSRIADREGFVVAYPN